MINRVWNRLTAALSGLVLAALASTGVHANDYANPHLLVSTAQLAGMIGQSNMRVIDVRSKADYDSGHIPGAVHMPADGVNDPAAHVDGARLPDEKLAQIFGGHGIDKDVHVVLYDDKGEFLAARLFWMLEYFGHRKAGILNGGVQKWTADGYKLSRDPATVKRADFALTPVERRIASADWLLERRNDSDVVVIDVRPTKMYESGHIPWARSIPWSMNLATDGTMKPAQVLRDQYAAFGVVPERNIAVHCQDGKASSHSYFTLRLLGFPRVRTYERSWAEWGADKDLPRAGSSKG